MITQEYLKERLDYNKETGVLVWKSKIGDDPETRRWNTLFTGKTAGALDKRSNYQVITIDNKTHLMHRIIYLLVTGIFPEQIDHINGIRYDNRWENLREASGSENQQNRKKSINNSSGFTGVYYHKQRKKYRAVIKLNSKRVQIGEYNSPEEAYSAFLSAKAEYHKFQPFLREG